MKPSSATKLSDLPVVAIVGRANVGKSTLWNKIIERRRALISTKPHTTRDRNTEVATWRGKSFQIVDTGGTDTEDNEIGRGIRRQAEHSIKEADAILFLMDAKTGVLSEDRELAKFLRKHKNKIILVANKVDHQKEVSSIAEGHVKGLGYGDPVMVSAASGKGVGDLLDKTYTLLNKLKKPPKDADVESLKAEVEKRPLRIVIMGRPNVGKSSLTNAILGEERVIVSDIPHTTREPQDTHLTYKGQEVVLVDTAGMRKRARVKKGLEKAAIEKNKDMLRRADIAFLVFDVNEEPGFQDRHLAGLMKDEHKGLILVANKWDLTKDKDSKSAKEFEARIRSAFPFLSWAPMVFVSAKTGKRTKDLLDLAFKVQEERNRKIDYNAVNRLLKSVIKQKRPLQILGPKSPYVYDMAQVSTEPPTFLVTVRGRKRSVHESWLKFLERKLREKYGFSGTAIVVRATNIPMEKADRAWNLQGPGMDAAEEEGEVKRAKKKITKEEAKKIKLRNQRRKR
jgi:GTP-binding protein